MNQLIGTRRRFPVRTMLERAAQGVCSMDAGPNGTAAPVGRKPQPCFASPSVEELFPVFPGGTSVGKPLSLQPLGIPVRTTGEQGPHLHRSVTSPPPRDVSGGQVLGGGGWAARSHHPAVTSYVTREI